MRKRHGTRLFEEHRVLVDLWLFPGGLLHPLASQNLMVDSEVCAYMCIIVETYVYAVGLSRIEICIKILLHLEWFLSFCIF